MTAPALTQSDISSEPGTLTRSSQMANSEISNNQLRRAIIPRQAERKIQQLRLKKATVSKPEIQSTASETIPEDTDQFKIINLPAFKAVPSFYNYTLAALQEWEGKVDSIDENSFFASLVDITRNEDTVTETAEIPLDAISEEDRERLVPGAIFRWVIGYANHPSGRENTSRFYFRRFGGSASAQGDIPPLCFETDD